MDSGKGAAVRLRMGAIAVILAFAAALPAIAQEAQETPKPPAAVEQSEERDIQHPGGSVHFQHIPTPKGTVEQALGEDFWNGGMFVAVVAILMVFGAPAVATVLLVYFLLRYRERRQKLHTETIQRFLDAGKDVPEDLLQPKTQESTAAQHLHQGILLLGFGLGLFVFLLLVAGFAISSLGFIFITIGVAKIIIWKLASQSPGQQD